MRRNVLRLNTGRNLTLGLLLFAIGCSHTQQPAPVQTKETTTYDHPLAVYRHPIQQYTDSAINQPAYQDTRSSFPYGAGSGYPYAGYYGNSDLVIGQNLGLYEYMYGPLYYQTQRPQQQQYHLPSNYVPVPGIMPPSQPSYVPVPDR